MRVDEGGGREGGQRSSCFGSPTTRGEASTAAQQQATDAERTRSEPAPKSSEGRGVVKPMSRTLLAMDPGPLDLLTVDEIYELTDVLNSAGITRSSSEESLESISSMGDVNAKMRYVLNHAPHPSMRHVQ